MEHVDIAEGAAYLIEKMAGGTVDVDRELINNAEIFRLDRADS